MLTWLDEIGAEDRGTVGIKATNQGRLLDTDVDVPRGFIAQPDFFTAYLQHHGIEDEVRGLLERLEEDDHAQKRLRSIIDSHPLPDHLQEEVGKHYDEINLSKGVRNAGSRALELIGGQREQDFVCVRASSISPHTGCRPEMSVTGGSNVGAAIRTLWKRFFSPTSLAVREDLTERPTVIVQRMIDAEVAGTVYTRHPVTGEDEIVVESIYGLGTPLYEGEADPDRYRIDRDSGTLEERDLTTKEWKKVQDPSTGSIVRRRVPSDDQDSGTLEDAVLKTVADEALDVESHLEGPVRVDFVIGRNRRQVLDSKPLEHVRDGNSGEGRDGIQGIGLAGGQASGPLVNSHDSPGIMVVDTPSQDKLARLPEMDAWVSPRRGISTNLAAASRSLGRPAVGRIRPDSDLHGQEVTIDGHQGMLWQAGSPATEPAAMGTDPSPTAPQRSPDQVQDQGTAQGQPSAPQGPSSALRVYGVGMERDGLDGRIVRSRGGFDWESRPVLRTPDRETDMRLIDGYEEVFEQDDSPVLVHVDALARAASAAQMRSALEYLLGTDRECVVLLREPDTELLELVVRHGANGIAVTASSADPIIQQLGRVEKRVLLEMLREQR